MDNVIKVFTILKEFEGIIGALLGTIVGAFISHIQNNAGNIKVFFEQTYYSFDSISSESEFDDNFKIIKTEFNTFHFRSDIEFYNSSNTRKILRNIKICIETDKEKKYIDLHTKDYNVVGTLNIDPNSIASFPESQSKFRSEKDTNDIFLNRTRNIYLVYKNEKGKRKKIKINKIIK